MHGYDVLDHTRINEEAGGRAAFERLVVACREAGLGIVVDVVPNHMTVPQPAHLNAPFWSLLREGRRSPYAGWFDVDWVAEEDRLLMPVLGGTVERALADGELVLADDGGPSGGDHVLRYYDAEFPVAAGTEALPLPELVDAQAYRLSSWREAGEALNYRRFFDVTSLVAVRVEDPVVFMATHALLLSLHGHGEVDGFRIDHPDGLADPGGYLERLADATGDAWVVVEKILEGEETLPESWRTAGTTGYDALLRVQQVLTPTAGLPALDRLWAQAAPDRVSLAAVVTEAKRLVVDDVQAAEVDRLMRLARRVLGDVDTAAVRRAPGVPPRRDGPLPGLRRAGPGGRPRAGRRGRAGRRARTGPARPERPRRAGDRRGPRPRPRRAAGEPRHPRGRRRLPRALPADLRPGHGQGHRGHRLLPVAPPRRGQRGRRPPRPPGHHDRRVPRVVRAPGRDVADVHDDPHDARHETLRGRPHPPHGPRRGRRGVGELGRGGAGHRGSPPRRTRRRPHRVPRLADPRRHLAHHRRAAGGVPPQGGAGGEGAHGLGRRRHRVRGRGRRLRPCPPPRPGGAEAPRRVDGRARAVGAGQHPRPEARAADHARRARRLPGLRDRHALARRPRQPPARRLDRPRRAPRAGARRRAGLRRRRREAARHDQGAAPAP